MTFTSKAGTYFWSNGLAWGTCKIGNKTAELSVLQGEIQLNSFTFNGVGTKKTEKHQTVRKYENECSTLNLEQ